MEADAEIRRLAGGADRKIDDVRLAVGVYDVGEFQRVGGDFGQVRAGWGYAGGREQSPAYLFAYVRMRVGEVFGSLGVMIGEDEHVGAGAADFGGHLRFGVAPGGSGGVGQIQEERGVVFGNKGRGFDVPVFDEPQVGGQFAEDAVCLGGYDGGAVGGVKLGEDGFGGGDEGRQGVYDGLGYAPGGFKVQFYRRPLNKILQPLIDNGFYIEKILEPEPTKDFKEKMPEAYERLLKRPNFLFIKARKIKDSMEYGRYFA